MNTTILPLSRPAVTAGFGSEAHAVIHDFLPAFAMAAGLMTVIWVACAVITIAGSFIGGYVFLGVRMLIRACVRSVRRRWGGEYAQLVTVDSDGVTAKPVNLRRARRWRARPATSDT